MINPNFKSNGSYRILAKDLKVSNDPFVTGLNNHDLIVGSTCSGKTGSYVTPNILVADSSMVVVDTKGLLYRRYRRYLENKGFKVVNIDFVNMEDSAVYNMLDYIRPSVSKRSNVPYRQRDLRTIAHALLPDGMDDEAFWVESARCVLCSLIAYVMEAIDEEERNMCTVAKLYLLLNKLVRNNISDNNLKGGIPFFEELRAENENSLAVQLYDTWSNSVMAEKMWVSICQFISVALEPFIYDDMKDIFEGKSTLDLAQLGREKTVLFVNISDSSRDMDAVINVFYQQLFQTLMNEADHREDGRLRVPVRIIMDDFGANFSIPDFDKLISVIRSRQIYVSIILQSISQLEGMYSVPQAKTIINNCDFKIFLGGQEPETARYIADMVGCLPETVMKLGSGEAYVIIRGEEPRRALKIAPYSMDEQMGL